MASPTTANTLASQTTSKVVGLEVSAIDRLPYKMDATQVALPGVEGLFVVLPGHAPLVSTLEIGVIRVQTAQGENRSFAIAGGVVRVLENQVLVLARTAEMDAQIDRDRAEASKKRAEERMKADERHKFDAARVEASLRRALARLQALSQHHQ